MIVDLTDGLRGCAVSNVDLAKIVLLLFGG